MGKHSAVDGAVIHPIVATALQQRTRSGAPPRPALGGPRAGDGSTGWPQDPRRGTGVGWPTDPQPTPVEDDGSVLAVLDAAAQAVEVTEPEPAAVATGAPVRRSGWRRLFGGGSTPHSTSAA